MSLDRLPGHDRVGDFQLRPHSGPASAFAAVAALRLRGNRRHHLQLPEADMAGIGPTPRFSVGTKDIRDPQCCSGHFRCGSHVLCKVVSKCPV